MANIRSFPNNQDEYNGAEDVMRWLHGRSSGVFGADGNASVAPVLDAMAITVSDGNGWISNDNADGVVWWIDNEETSGNKLQLEIDMADAVLPRIDRVVVSWQTTNYVALPEVKILKGTAASNPVAPALTNNNILRQISLASIRIPAGATAITSAMITDERLDDSVCGLVTNGIGVDTSVMQEQFSALLKSIKQELADLNNDSAALLKAGGTMYGDLDMGGNKIHNIPTPTDDNDATTKAYVDALTDGKLSMELLWKLADGVTSMSATELPMTKVDYTHYMVDFRGLMPSMIFRKGTRAHANYSLVSGKAANSSTASATTVTWYSRLISFMNTSESNPICEVSKCWYAYYASSGSKWEATTESSGALVPYRIWGIRGLSE